MKDAFFVLCQERCPPVIQKVFASFKTHLWWWIAGIIVLVAIATGITLWQTGYFGPSGKEVCRISVQRAMDYGTLPQDAKQAGSAESTKVSGRKTCAVTSGDDKYVVTVDVKCKNLKDDKCLSLYSVERSDGLSFYQKRAVPPVPDDSNASPAALPADAAGDNGVIDTDIETTPDTSGQ